MALELAVSVPPVHDRLAADVLFRRLRKQVGDQRLSRRPVRRRHRIVAALTAGGQCDVCGERRPDPRATCPGEQ